ncbi:alpha/beta hydrolase fold domain-containing protein [Streptomyces sp. KL116D]|uniref:alpha/beta hydrolase fold domain-containing protein n=1 Tax=Streptomyces sp. KL116D TaxID=3045152 RepID=UPI003556414F
MCISANYRLRPQTIFPGHQIDAKKVIAWVREHGSEYSDPSQLFVAGSSAGSNTAALCALTPNDPSFQPGVRVGDTSVTAAICLYGYYGHFFGNHRTSPPLPSSLEGYVHAGAPPFLVAHGTKDMRGTVERTELRRAAAARLEQCRRLRRTARWAAFIRRLSLCAFRGGRGRGGSLRRLGSRLPSALPILLPSLLGSAAQELGFGSGVTCNHAA